MQCKKLFTVECKKLITLQCKKVLDICNQIRLLVRQAVHFLPEAMRMFAVSHPDVQIVPHFQYENGVESFLREEAVMIMMNNNLRIFIQVAERGSFTQVANELYISQPAISRAIKALEDELKVKLFFRDKRSGLILTDAGEKILKLARQMADTENRIYQTAFRENNFLGGKVRVASMPILTSVILSKVFYQFREKYPYVTLELLEGSSAEIRKAVEEHQVDFGLTSSPFDDLDKQVVFMDRMVSVNREPFPSDNPVPLNENTEKYILCRAGYETVLEELKGQKIKLDHCFTVQQAETVINLVKQGNGIGILSELVLNATPNNLYRHTISPEVEMAIGIIASDLSDLTPVASTLAYMVREECESYASGHK